MLNPYGFYLIIQLSLAAGMISDWSIQRTPCRLNVGTRVYLQMIPPRIDRPDPGDARKWQAPLKRDTKSSHSHHQSH
ncbi:unnamed protein product [Pleuronectes platessa]|uniref:Secreted protein n=1 Tax=Pleuronectes platessa TaxID=8262 RepID=A0A9N7UAY6_PLEPL|nr:unnamed protein product [Pleuronectes platessa]